MNHAANYQVRRQHNRVLPEGERAVGESHGQRAAGAIRFEMTPGRGRKASAVEQEVRSERVVLSDRQGGQLEVTFFNPSHYK